MGASLSIDTFANQLFTEGPDSVNPNVFPPTSHNVAGGHISIQFNLSGPLIHFASGNLSSHLAIIYGADLISLRRADVVVCGGWELLSPDLSNRLTESGNTSLIPGASLFVIESKAHAKNRKAAIMATMCPQLSTVGNLIDTDQQSHSSQLIPAALINKSYGCSGALSLAAVLLDNPQTVGPAEIPIVITGKDNTQSVAFAINKANNKINRAQ